MLTINCRRYLTILWYSGSVILALILIIQTNTGHYGNKAGEAWGWFVATIMPSLSLITGAWTKNIREQKVIIGRTEKFHFALAFSVSFLYLCASFTPIIFQGLDGMRPPTELLRESHLYLGIFQGIVCGYLGAFFIKKPKGELG